MRAIPDFTNRGRPEFAYDLRFFLASRGNKMSHANEFDQKWNKDNMQLDLLVIHFEHPRSSKKASSQGKQFGYGNCWKYPLYLADIDLVAKLLNGPVNALTKVGHTVFGANFLQTDNARQPSLPRHARVTWVRNLLKFEMYVKCLCLRVFALMSVQTTLCIDLPTGSLTASGMQQPGSYR